MILAKVFIWLLVLIALCEWTIEQFLFDENIQGQLLPQPVLGNLLYRLSPLQYVGIGLLVFGMITGSSKSAADAAADTCITTDYTRDVTTGVCYKVITITYLVRENAIAACNSFGGGRLLRVDSTAVQTLASGLLTDNLLSASWIDGTRTSSSSSVYLDSDGVPLTFFDWQPGSPGHICCTLSILATGQMRPGPGGAVAINVICELPPRR